MIRNALWLLDKIHGKVGKKSVKCMGKKRYASEKIIGII
jgi:hypothetical protein